jgi:hypothetical protein
VGNDKVYDRRYRLFYRTGHAITFSRMPATHSAAETHASNKPGCSMTSFFLRGVAAGQ